MAVRLSVCPFVRLSVCPFVCLFVCLVVCLLASYALSIVFEGAKKTTRKSRNLPWQSRSQVCERMLSYVVHCTTNNQFDLSPSAVGCYYLMSSWYCTLMACLSHRTLRVVQINECTEQIAWKDTHSKRRCAALARTSAEPFCRIILPNHFVASSILGLGSLHELSEVQSKPCDE
jgi:hypothetical protein